MKYAVARNSTDGPPVELARRRARDDLAEQWDPVSGGWTTPASLEARLERDPEWSPIGEAQLSAVMREIVDYWELPQRP